MTPTCRFLVLISDLCICQSVTSLQKNKERSRVTTVGFPSVTSLKLGLPDRSFALVDGWTGFLFYIYYFFSPQWWHWKHKLKFFHPTLYLRSFQPFYRVLPGPLSTYPRNFVCVKHTDGRRLESAAETEESRFLKSFLPMLTNEAFGVHKHIAVFLSFAPEPWRWPERNEGMNKVDRKIFFSATLSGCSTVSWLLFAVSTSVDLDPACRNFSFVWFFSWNGFYGITWQAEKKRKKKHGK